MARTSSKILNYTTTVSAQSSIAEIQRMLAQAGATSVTMIYESALPTGIEFSLLVGSNMFSFRLPCNMKGVVSVLAKAEPRYRRPEHIAAVSWRILKDWTEAQLAIIQAQMAQPSEVFFPYMLTSGGMTVYERAAGQARGLLELRD